MFLDDILVKLKKKQEKISYTYQNISYTYYDFYRFVCNIYHFLKKENSSKKPIMVYGQKQIYQKATFLACSFAGMAYVPISQETPVDRMKKIVEQVEPGLIIGDLEAEGIKNFSQQEIEKIMKKEQYEEIETIAIKPEDIYYIIFTSGSTGIPKGVKVSYKNVNSCIRWLQKITNAKNEIILNQADFSFDLSVADLYLSLVSESEHYILENNHKMDFAKLFENLRKSNATLAVLTPSFADLLLLDKRFDEALMPNLRKILFCGEQLLKSTVDKLYERFSKLKIINLYGPTECTFAVTSMEIPRNFQFETIPCGKVKQDCEIVILDEQGNSVKEGDLGEILIAGESVASGYVAENGMDRFVTYHHQPAYLTGDLGYLKNGILYYKCRKDRQIKWKGYRIELADIEKNLLDLAYVERAVVVAKRKDDKISKMIAFVKVKENVEKDVLGIKRDLEQKIPSYMCPTIKIVTEFPMNQNGKCDEQKLLEDY